ncbi:NrdH-redoxin [Candidatus Micrarchaeota archaeon]|nr:NrdH-redoxin [Candidatus Micrarchaeota archaeon]
MEEKKVILYTSQNCPFCGNVKTFLKQRGIEFEEYDVSSNQEKAVEMFKKSGKRSVPMLDIGGRIVVGFDPVQIEKALNAPRLDRNSALSNLFFDPFDQ